MKLELSVSEEIPGYGELAIAGVVTEGNELPTGCNLVVLVLKLAKNATRPFRKSEGIIRPVSGGQESLYIFTTPIQGKLSDPKAFLSAEVAKLLRAETQLEAIFKEDGVDGEYE